jgi:aspartyl-tRNA(Asn)/glutamyl-tRNA(Gln) amidotransferase subunit B
LMGDVFAALNRDSKTIETMTLPAAHLAQLVDLILDDTISGKIAKDVFLKMWESGKEPAALVEELGLRQISDTGAIEAAIDELLARDTAKVAEYKSGKEQLFGYFVGQIMKAMQGKANPGVVNELLKKKLG